MACLARSVARLSRGTALLAVGTTLAVGCRVGSGGAVDVDGGRDAGASLDAGAQDASVVRDAWPATDATIGPVTPCEMPPACIGELCYALGAPLGSQASVSFAEPDGSLWVIDGAQRTWRLHEGAWSIADPQPVLVFLAEGERQWGIRDPDTAGAVLVVRAGEAPFEPVAGAPPGPSGALGVSSTDLWVLAAGALHHWDGERFATSSWPCLGTFVSAWAPASNDLWLTVSLGPLGNTGRLHHWDGERWSEVALPVGAEPRWIGGHPRGDRWLLSIDGALLDGTDGWRSVAEVAESDYPGPPPGPPYGEQFPTPDSLAVTADGAVWVARPDGLLGRWMGGAWAPLVDPPEVRGRLVAQGDGVWMGGPGAWSRSSTHGLSRIEASRSCGGERVGPIADLVVAAGRPVVSWRVPRPPPTWGTPTLISALGAAGWWTTDLARQRVEDLFEGAGAAWALTTEPADLGAGVPRSHLLRLEGERWVEQAALQGRALRGHVSADGSAWVLIADDAGTPEDLADDQTRVFRVRDGTVELGLDAPADSVVGAGERVWVSGVAGDGYALWSWDGTRWLSLPEPPGLVIAVSREGVLWTRWPDIHRGDGTRWEPICLSTEPYELVPHGVGAYLQTDEGWRFHDGTDLREVPGVPQGTLALDGEAAWLATALGVVTGALPAAGAVLACP